MFGHRCTRWAIVAVFALAMAWPVATGGAATIQTGAVPPKLLGVWHKTMTRAQWQRAGVYPRRRRLHIRGQEDRGRHHLQAGRLSNGVQRLYEDFTTTFRPNGGRLTLGSVPVCSFKGVYSWHLTGRTLIVTPVADKRCVVRETFFGGRWKR